MLAREEERKKTSGLASASLNFPGADRGASESGVTRDPHLLVSNMANPCAAMALYDFGPENHAERAFVRDETRFLRG